MIGIWVLWEMKNHFYKISLGWRDSSAILCVIQFSFAHFKECRFPLAMPLPVPLAQLFSVRGIVPAELGGDDWPLLLWERALEERRRLRLENSGVHLMMGK